MYPPSMKQPSGWFSILKFKASWSFANFEMGVSLHSLGFPWIPIRHLQTPEGSHRDDRLDARNCWWCSGDPPRKCAKAMVSQRKWSRTGGGYISFHTYVQLPEIWYPWLASLDALPHFCAILDGSRPAMWSHDAAWDIQKHATGKIKSDDHSQFYMGYIHWLMYGMWIIQ